MPQNHDAFAILDQIHKPGELRFRVMDIDSARPSLVLFPI
jgi:hypothetical protein